MDTTNKEAVTEFLRSQPRAMTIYEVKCATGLPTVTVEQIILDGEGTDFLRITVKENGSIDNTNDRWTLNS